MSASPIVVLATRNSGKAREFGRLLEGAFALRVVPADIALPEETGETFAENARLKAATVFAALGGETAVLADDSGLQVKALGGSPGVQSARYAGHDAGDEENVRKLLAELSGSDDRTARFVCVLCLILPRAQRDAGKVVEAGETVEAREMTSAGKTPRVFVAEGLLEGTIAPSPRGTDGFGYDPIFEPFGWTETLSEAHAADKDRVSHRGAAARALLIRLRTDGVITDGTADGTADGT